MVAVVPSKNPVAIGPGCEAMTCTPDPRNSSASDSLKESTNALLAA
jgi:hypothetical protein